MTDLELILLARGGDEVAFRRLLRRHQRTVEVAMRGYYTPDGDLDDLRQEALIGFHKAVRDYRPAAGVPFPGFAHVCARRQVITRVKNATRVKHRSLSTAVSIDTPIQEDSDATLADVLPDPCSDAASLITTQDQLLEVIAAAWLHLSERERRAFGMWLAGDSYEDIAEVLGGNRKTIDNALQRVTRKLAEGVAA